MTNGRRAREPIPAIAAGNDPWPVQNPLVRLQGLPPARCRARLLPGFSCVPGELTPPTFHRQPALLSGYQSLARLCSRLYLVTIANACLVIEPGLDGLVFVDQRVIFETQRFRIFRNANPALHRDRFITPPDSANVVEELEQAFVCFDPGWTNYFHWIAMVAPKLVVADRCLPASVPFLLPNLFNHAAAARPAALTPGILDATLHHLALERPLRRLQPGYYRIGRLSLIIPDVWQGFGLAAHSAAAAAFARWRTNVPPPDDSPPIEHIFISRARTSDPRMPFDESQSQRLAAGLHELGVATVTLEAMSFDAQVNLFRRARLVVAPHGAGLANLLFAPRRLNILELHKCTAGEPAPRLMYAYLSQLRGQNYRLLDGSTKPLLADSVLENVEEMMGHRCS